MTAGKHINVYIRSRTKNVFKGFAYSVTGLNEKGEFDILPLHQNFISMVSNYILLDKGRTSQKEIAIQSGVLKCEEDTVDVFLEV